MPLDLAQVCIEPLNDLHRRGRFRCSNKQIQNLCRGGLADQHRVSALRAFIARANGSMDVLGYYYLMTTSVEREDAARTAGGHFELLDKIPALYLGMIGVHADHARQGLGTQLMLHAFRQVDQISRLAGVWALILDAIDEEAARFYERFDFKRFEEGKLEMYLPIGTIRILVEELDEAPELEGDAA